MIYPKCKNIVPGYPGNAMSIRASGHVVPCCFFGGEEQWNELKKLLGDDYKNLHISTGKTLDEFNKSKEFQQIEKTWHDPFQQILGVCVGACSTKEHLHNEDKTSTGSDKKAKKL